MADYIQAWQCIGCGKIEAPQTCIGVCRDRKVFFIGRDEHERALAEVAALRAKLECARTMLLRFGLAKPGKGQHERAWQALHEQVREVLKTFETSAP